MTRGLGLGVLGAGHTRHACDGTRGGARGWCKSWRLEVVWHNVRGERKSRWGQGGEPEARGGIITGPLPQIGRYHVTSCLDRFVPAVAKLPSRAPGARGANVLTTIAFELPPTHFCDMI
jgi:hypothetical protein